MRKTPFALLFIAIVFTTSLGYATAAPGANGFVLSRVSGESMARTPNAAEFSAAETNAVYAWGTRFKTGADAEIVVALAEGGVARIMANAHAIIERDSGRSPRLRIVMEDGMVHVALEPAFHDRQSLAVETASLICTPIGSAFTVGVGSKPDVKMTVITVTKGSVKVEGKQHPLPVFDIPVLQAGDQASIAASTNKTWFRIKSHKGEFVVEVPGEDAERKPVTLPPEHMIRIVIAPSETDPDLFHITVLLIDADGETPTAAWTTQKRRSRAPSREIEPFEPSVLPVPATTTTTIPSPTPVGDR